MKRILWAALIITLSITGCATNPHYSLPEQVSENAAVNNLYDEAGRNTHNEHYEAATANIERALRIESDNPYLWFQLAQLAKLQGDIDKAKELANRANRFAAGASDLQVQIKQFLRNL